MKVALAVDGSKSAARAVEALVKHIQALREQPEVDVLFVHLPLRPVGSMYDVAVDQEALAQYYERDAEEVLAATLKRLSQAGVSHKRHLLIGDPATQISNFAREHRCDLIFMGTRGMSNIGNLFLGSTAQKVLHLSEVPVVLTPMQREKAEPLYVGASMHT